MQNDDSKQKFVTWGKTRKYSFYLVAALLFFVFVYPTPYAYVSKYPMVVRVNRFTGVQEFSGDKGWDNPDETSKSKAISVAEFHNENGEFFVIVRNGGKDVAESPFLTFTLLSRDGTVIGKRSQTVEGTIRPGESAKVVIEMPTYEHLDKSEVGSIRID